MTPNHQRALDGLLTCPTKKQAAAAAGITDRTLRTYLADPGFQAEYRKAVAGVVEDATRQAQDALNPAITALRCIVEDEGEKSGNRIAAARTLLEYGLKLTEFNDILRDLMDAEG